MSVLRCRALSRSFGAALRGIRDNEPRMRALGYPTSLYKYGVFVVAGGVAGIAGSLLVAQQRLVTPADLGFTTASFALLAVIIGGAGECPNSRMSVVWPLAVVMASPSVTDGTTME